MLSFIINYPTTKKGKSEWNRRFGLNAYYAGKHPQKRRKDAEELHMIAQEQDARPTGEGEILLG